MTFQGGRADERYEEVLERTGLLEAAPPSQLASHIGVTPSSLSRIRARRAQGY